MLGENTEGYAVSKGWQITWTVEHRCGCALVTDQLILSSEHLKLDSVQIPGAPWTSCLLCGVAFRESGVGSVWGFWDTDEGGGVDN